MIFSHFVILFANYIHFLGKEKNYLDWNWVLATIIFTSPVVLFTWGLMHGPSSSMGYEAIPLLVAIGVHSIFSIIFLISVVLNREYNKKI